MSVYFVVCRAEPFKKDVLVLAFAMPDIAVTIGGAMANPYFLVMIRTALDAEP